MLEAFGWESPAEVGGVARLSSGGASGGLLGGKLGGAERVGGGRHGGVGCVAAELRFQLADAVLRGVETLAQVGGGRGGHADDGFLHEVPRLLPRTQRAAVGAR